MLLHTFAVKYSVIEVAEKERVNKMSSWSVTGNDFLKSMLDEVKVPNRQESTVIAAVDNAWGIGVPEKVIAHMGGEEKAKELDLIITKTVYIGKQV